jgi:hypothetical protein
VHPSHRLVRHSKNISKRARESKSNLKFLVICFKKTKFRGTLKKSAAAHRLGIPAVATVQTSSEVHPASSYTMGTGGPFPGVKRGRGVTLTTFPNLVPKSRMSGSYISTPWRMHGGSGTALVLLLQGCFQFCRHDIVLMAVTDFTWELHNPRKKQDILS